MQNYAKLSDEQFPDIAQYDIVAKKKGEKAKKINQKSMRTRTHTHTHKANMCRQIVLADVQLLVHFPLCVSYFFSPFYFDVIARTHKCRALVGPPPPSVASVQLGLSMPRHATRNDSGCGSSRNVSGSGSGSGNNATKHVLPFRLLVICFCHTVVAKL